MAKRRKSRKQKQIKQQQQMYMVGGIAGVAILLAIVVIALSQSSTNADVCGEINDEECYGEYLATEERGATEDFIPYIGSVEAPVIVAEFSNFTCIHCANYHTTLEQLIDEFAADGQAQFRYMPMTTDQYSANAADAAICAAEQDGFWPLHVELFEVMQAQGGSAFDRDTVIEMAVEMGMDKGELEDCMNSNRPRAAVATSRALASQLGVTGTPTLAFSLDNGETWEVFSNRDFAVIASTIRQFSNASS